MHLLMEKWENSVLVGYILRVIVRATSTPRSSYVHYLKAIGLSFQRVPLNFVYC